MIGYIRWLSLRVPFIGTRLRRWQAASELIERLEPGDYYSPIASDQEISLHARVDFAPGRTIQRSELQMRGICLDPDTQVKLLKQFEEAGYFKLEWMNRYSKNEFFHSMDAIVLHSMISRYRPRRIIEIGSGFSTLAILDSLDANSLHETKPLLIEPFPERLLENVGAEDSDRFELRRRPLATGDLTEIQSLKANDLLIVDSSHIYKIGSDVQLLFEHMIPVLSEGVVVHFHDVFFPFDYPASWLLRGHHYNEAYVLRSFLQFNQCFEILLWNDLMKHLSDTDVPTTVLQPQDQIACSFWLRRTAND